MNRAFRIEQYMGSSDAAPTASDPSGAHRHSELMQAIEEVKLGLHGRPDHEESNVTSLQDIAKAEEELKQKQVELLRVKDEMREIYMAMDDT